MGRKMRDGGKSSDNNIDELKEQFQQNEEQKRARRMREAEAKERAEAAGEEYIPEQYDEDGNLSSVGANAGVEAWIEKNRWPLFGLIGLLVLAAIAYFGYTRVIMPPKETAAQNSIYMAQEWFAKDSFRLALEGNAQNDGFLNVIDNSSGTKTGNLAQYYAGVSYYNLGEYDNAIDYLSKFNGKDLILSAMAIGLQGDAHAAQDDLGTAIDMYKRAARHNDNDYTSPLFLYKAGLAMESEGNYSGAADAYQTIKDKYPESSQGRSIDKFITRVAMMQ